MNTLIRKGRTLFYGDHSFSHGISRSGYFNKRESEELALYGATFEGLCNGTLTPENEEEQQFLQAMQSAEESGLYPVKLWKKYLHSVEKSRIHHGFAMSNAKAKDPIVTDLSFV